jgi:23S rRNA pseudouridine1911/1915/1917 synthase
VPTPNGFEILYEQGPCLVVAKPGGLLTQAPPNIDSLESRVKAFLKERDQKTGNIYLAVIHRLDRPVSGAVVCARHVRAAKRLSEQFENRSVQKQYWALVKGIIEPAIGTLRDFLRKVPDEPRAELVASEHPDAREAVLHYRTMEIRDDHSLIEIALETGRMHQIRLQLASRGFPILGDEQYGSRQPYGPTTDDPRARWIALHARRIVLRHPMTRDVVDVTAPVKWFS